MSAGRLSALVEREEQGVSSGPGEFLVGWSIGLAREVDIPGWLYLPPGLNDAEQELWVCEAATAVLGLVNESRPDEPVARTDVCEVLRAGLQARAASDAPMLYQVWPVAAPAAVMCEVTAALTADLPDWTRLPGRIHAAQARHIGPGLQYSTRRVIEDEEGLTEVSAVHFVFADAEHAVMLSLLESLSPLIAHALVPLGQFKSALTVTRADGSLFASSAPQT